MRDDLDSLAKVITPSLLLNYLLVDLASCYIIRFGSFDTQKTLIVAQVKICFRTINSHIALSMFVRVQGSRIYIDIGIQFLDSNG